MFGTGYTVMSIESMTPDMTDMHLTCHQRIGVRRIVFIVRSVIIWMPNQILSVYFNSINGLRSSYADLLIIGFPHLSGNGISPLLQLLANQTANYLPYILITLSNYIFSINGSSLGHLTSTFFLHDPLGLR